MCKFKVVVENPTSAYILDQEEKKIISLCTTKRPDLGFKKLEELVSNANQYHQTHKNCEWCKENPGVFWEHDPDGEGCFMNINSRNKVIAAWSPEHCSNFDMQMDIKFCPICGREL